MESSEAGELAYLECCTEVRLLSLLPVLFCTWPANSPFLFVCIFFVLHY